MCESKKESCFTYSSRRGRGSGASQRRRPSLPASPLRPLAPRSRDCLSETANERGYTDAITWGKRAQKAFRFGADIARCLTQCTWRKKLKDHRQWSKELLGQGSKQKRARDRSIVQGTVHRRRLVLQRRALAVELRAPVRTSIAGTLGMQPRCQHYVTICLTRSRHCRAVPAAWRRMALGSASTARPHRR